MAPSLLGVRGALNSGGIPLKGCTLPALRPHVLVLPTRPGENGKIRKRTPKKQQKNPHDQTQPSFVVPQNEDASPQGTGMILPKGSPTLFVPFLSHFALMGPKPKTSAP